MKILNPKLLTWNFNREANMKIQDALLSTSSFALLSGKAVTSGSSATLHKREIVTACADPGALESAISVTFSDGAALATAQQVTLTTVADLGTSYTVDGISGDTYSVIGQKLADKVNATSTTVRARAITNGVILSKLAGTAVSANTATISIGTWTVTKALVAPTALVMLLTSRVPSSTATTFVYPWDATLGNEGTLVTSSTLTSGTCGLSAATPFTPAAQYVVYYKYASLASTTVVMKINSDSFPGYYKIVGDTVVVNASTGKPESFQLVANKVKVASNFNMEMKSDGDPSIFDMDITILKEEANTDMVTMYKY